LGIKKVAQKQEKATFESEEAVSLCYKGGMMADPLGRITFPFIELKMSSSPMVVKDQGRGPYRR
jgi:hypothetical protein